MQAIGAVDIGGTKIALGLVSIRGQVLASLALPSQPEKSFLLDMLEIAAGLDRLLAQTNADLLGIGLGCTGQVNSVSGEVLKNGFLPHWAGQNPARWLSEHYEVSTALENDADAAALAEWQWGAGSGASRFIYLTVSTGIGAGLIFDGQVYRGAGGAHPEIGHHTIEPSGPTCFCGNRGCWEAVASGRALSARLQSLLPDFNRDAAAVCDLAEAGHPLAQQAVAAHGQALGVGLANLITLYAPDTIALGGGLMSRAALFLPAIQVNLAERCRLISAVHTRLALSHFGANTGLAGAAMAWVHRQAQAKA